MNFLSWGIEGSVYAYVKIILSIARIKIIVFFMFWAEHQIHQERNQKLLIVGDNLGYTHLNALRLLMPQLA